MLLTVISFVVVMGVVVFVHELGHFLAAKRSKIVVEEFGFGFPPRLLKLFERDGTVYSLNWIPFGGFVRMRGEDDPSLAGSFGAASRRARAGTLLAGPAMNFLLAIVLFAVVAGVQGVPDPTRPGVVVQGIAAGSPAEEAALQVGDLLVAADGRPIATVADLQEHTAGSSGKTVAYAVVRSDPQTGEATSLTVTMTPRANPPSGEGALGIQIGTATRPAKLWEAVWGGVKSVGEIVYLTLALPANLIREGKPIADAGFMGPVGIAVASGEFVRSALAIESVLPVILFVALLSTALGITNLLPLPALDGGRLLFVVVEALRGKRIEPDREGRVHLIGFGLLLLLVGLLTVREISSLLNGTFPSLGIR